VTSEERMKLAERIAKHDAPFLGDVKVENHGSLILLKTLTPAAVAWVEENVSRSGFQPYWPFLVCEPRYTQAVIDGARTAGLVVR
jgi:hypothetical protein